MNRENQLPSDHHSTEAAASDPGASAVAELSLVVPCYNEEDSVGQTLPQLLDAFAAAGRRLQIIAVDNGSIDKTGDIIASLAAERPEVVPVQVEVNIGYGNGVLSGFPHASADWIGSIPADGQVDATDVVRLFEAVSTTDGNVLGKVRRRFRMDGLTRKLVSVVYNLFFRVLWPSVRTLDVNGSPKIFPRRILSQLDLRSRGWFLDPELIVRSHYMGLRVFELNVFARMRGSGLSHVRAGACWEFLWRLIALRFSPQIMRWRRQIKNTKAAPAS